MREDPLALPKKTLCLSELCADILYTDDAGRVRVRVLPFSQCLCELFLPVMVGGKLFVYDVSSGLYAENVRCVEAEVQRLTGDSEVVLNAIYRGEEEHRVNRTLVFVTNSLPVF